MLHLLFLMFFASTGSGMPDVMWQDKYIIGGRDTNITEVPYQAVLFHNTGFCGATIVGERHLLTAAHCIKDCRKYSVRVGSSFRDKGGVVHKVKRAVTHPSYVPMGGSPDYDVAFLEVEEPIKFNAYAQPIAVVDAEPKGGDATKISGYGRNGIQSFPKQLQSADVFVLDRVKCAEMFDHEVTRRMICTISKDFQSCAFSGDSGGPMVVNGKVAGAASWGNRLAPCDLPTVYANFADPEIRKFIKDNTGV